MANAAAKKAAAAQKNATSKVLPILLALNFIHVFIIFQRGTFSTYRILMTLFQWILTYVSYQGIIRDIAQSTNAVHSSLEKKKLAGGAWLDLMFLVLLSQFGSLFLHEIFMDLILFVIPVVYGLYHYFVKKNCNAGGEGSNHGKEPQDEESRKLLEERRRKRAERRRQKRF